ncbi:MAG: hypothetical protein GXO57_06445 [Thermodesulfobacteria bacterium]|nr:hypothetical protein [Thermodesulfobacteriota bacterium]
MRTYGVAVRKTRVFKVNSDSALAKGKTKKAVKAWITNLLFGILVCVNLFTLVVFLCKTYTFIKLKLELNQLQKENKELTKVYNQMTSRVILEKKAKEFGLRPPTQKDVIKLR